jgi:hypothetical protein
MVRTLHCTLRSVEGLPDLSDDELALAHCEALQGLLSSARSNRHNVASLASQADATVEAHLCQLAFVFACGVRSGHVRPFRMP